MTLRLEMGLLKLILKECKITWEINIDNRATVK